MSLKLALPNDVLIRVFKELDAYDLRRCSLTCRVFHETIRDTLLLQYRLELSVAGLEDGSTDCRLSIPERLAQLKTFEQAWAKLYFRQRLTVNVARGYVWKLRGDVLATQLMSRLLFIQLPSAVRGTPVHTWESHIEVHIRQFAIDPAQDLAVVVAWPPTYREHWHTFLIHLRTMSTGVCHPCATDPVLSCVPTFLDTQYDISIQIMGEFLAVLYHTPAGHLRDLLFIWDWKTGQLLIFLEASSLGADILSFSFLSLRHFVIARCIPEPDGCYQPQLVVYDFIAARPQGSMEPWLVRIYQLPRVAQYTLTRSFTLTSEPSSELPTSSGNSFYHTSCSRLLTVIMRFTMHFTYVEDFVPDSQYMLFVHASSLLEEVDARLNAEQLTVPWDSWGPLKTRILPIRTYDVEDSRPYFHVYGTRYVRQEVVDDVHWRVRNRLRMLDFNPLALRRALSSNDPPFSPSEDESGAFSTTIVKDSQPTMIHEYESGFTQRLSTALPYRDVIRRGIFDTAHVMIGRECVVLLDRWPDVKSWNGIDIEFLCI
ncbi:hypothetical protein JB92DRAFT_2999971 [Gautieria morchelliformis]|nr:hypothetical protein JB92DRAFT_2999971 [Gautieria morchelliformis]